MISADFENVLSHLSAIMDTFGEMQCGIAEARGKNTSRIEPEMEPEKVDLSPENSKKSDSSPIDSQISKQPPTEEGNVAEARVQYSNSTYYSGLDDCVNKNVSTQELNKNERSVSEDPEVKNALAFTIDFGQGRKSVDTQRHEKMLERFQNRHKRGVSLSKLEPLPVSSAGKINVPQSVNLPRKNKAAPLETTNTEVKLRDKTKVLKDTANKRHSWSPRTSMTEAAAKESPQQIKHSKFLPKSTTLQMTLEQKNIRDGYSSSDFNAESLDSSIGLPCIEPPLQNFRSEDENDSVSEAGTYTLDGDNYTEEQKERMNIDRMPPVTQDSTMKPLFTTEFNPVNPQRPTNFRDELEVIDLDQPCPGRNFDGARQKNILEVSYFHDSASVQPTKQKQSYLEKLKSRVKNITHKTKSPDRQLQLQQLNSPDQGTFTSVTTSGVLSVKPSLENHPRIRRRNSLTKSHIDSSEYVQGIAKLNIHTNGEAKILNCYTDSEKATGAQEYDEMYDSPKRQIAADASVISSAVSKKDWIQEWAKSAREYSKQPAQSSSNNNIVNSSMTRSYDFESRNQFGYDFDIDMTKSDYYDAKKYEEFGDNLDRQHMHRKQLDRLLNNSSNSDPSIRQGHAGESGFNEFSRRGSIRQYTSPNAAKPPMSPSKIPSPIGSVGRARSVSRNRSLQGSNSDLSTNETEMYLQKTAAAISTLQNIHRRNSIRCSSQQNSSHSSPLSPASRRMSPKMSPMNSYQSPVHLSYQDKSRNVDGQKYSPQHQQLRNSKQQQFQQQNLMNHKRNLSLDDSDTYMNVLTSLGYGNQMSNSLNSENAILDFKKQHTRHNSFEGTSALPPKPIKCFQNFDQTTAHYGVKINDNLNVPNDVDDEDTENELILVTTTMQDLSLSAKKVDAISTKQQLYSTGGKSATAQSRATGPSTSRVTPSKVVSAQISSPIKRSSSFSVKAMKPTTPTLTPKLGTRTGTKIQKSASSTSFKKMVSDYKDDKDEFYINDDDDLELNTEYSSNSEFSDKDDDAIETEKEPITNTRYNKTFLMRMEQNKKIVAGVKQGVSACPNTPELPRRALQVKTNTRERASMPRDSSLNRMRQDLHMSRKSVGKEFASKESTPVPTANSGKQKVQPKYLDISKYKTTNAPSFLKKDESKSYLTKTEVRKSPSSASVALNRAEPGRMSTRSVKSAGAKLPSARKEAQKNAKEQELEMWRRRASYDPMKAVQESKRKQEEAKRQAQQQAERLSKFNESSVLRSQSYHCGVGIDIAPSHHSRIDDTIERGAFDHTMKMGSSNHSSNRWTVTSTESSDEFDDDGN